ncbi:NAD(P)-binding protein [Suillus ampliporus]|nr:NAD(P)-binding protein [Suillus ampliporus]
MTSCSKGVALITGAGQGIGRAIALRLAADGFDIGLSDISTNKYKLEEVAREIATAHLGRRVCVLLADVTIEDDVRSMVDSVVTELGGLDVMVANAGIIHAAPLVETTTEAWEKIFAVNVRGVFLSYKYAAQKMIALNEIHKRGRRIIGASSVSGKRGGEYVSAYCASKFAVRGLTQSAATELGQHGITVNAYAPGTVVTDMLNSVITATMKLTGLSDRNVYDENVRYVGYTGTPDDIAGLVSYIASAESHFITGEHYMNPFRYPKVVVRLIPMAAMTSCSKGVALITGAGQGIGRAIALRLAADGFDIGLSDISTNKSKLEEVAQEITTAHSGRRVCALLADVRIEDDVRSMVDGVVTELGGLDVMVANAGILHAAPLVETKTEDLEKIFAVNIRGVFLCYKYAAQKMISLNETHKRGRRIIGASSLAGKRGASQYFSAYSASKFAVRGLTQSAAIELGQHGITVNAYAPGTVVTDMPERHTWVTDSSVAAAMLKLPGPVRHAEYIGTPDDVAGLVSYIASAESHFITGKHYRTFPAICPDDYRPTGQCVSTTLRACARRLRTVQIIIDGGTHFD